YEWNIDDDFQPLNITDNEILDERITNRITNDDEAEDSYITAYHQLLQTHQQQQQQIMAQQEQENMLSTIFEASCEDATPMTSLVDVHQQRIQISPPLPSIRITKDNHISHSDEEEEEEEEYEEKVVRPIAPSFSSIDDIPVSTIFTKNEIQNSSFTNDSSSKLAYSYSTIEENLQCPMCHTRFHDPRVLPCQHIYCCSCLKRIISSNKSCTTTIVCSLCYQRFSFQNIEQIPKSYIHNNLLDLIPINYDIKGNCSKCKINTLLNLCPCCDYYLCKICFENDRKNLLINV
ncbi:unnamed protein product, partial [Rotaria sp. Silwood2]